jgi:hypothetical protein
MPGATGTRHLPREFKMPNRRETSFPSTSEQTGTPFQRQQGLVRGRGERATQPGEVTTKASNVAPGRTGLREHWEHHGPEFPEYKNAREYEAGAIDFCRDPSTRRFYYRFRGRPGIGYYNAETGTFASSSVNGKTIFTYMRPGPEGIEGILRASRTPEAPAGQPRQMPPGVLPRDAEPFPRDDE